MAQLPPKVPNMKPSCHDFPHQRMTSIENLPPGTTNHAPSWVNEFLDFSAGKRGSHRRSISESIAFIDDDQFMSMLVNEMVAGPTKSSSNTSTLPSDQNSMNDEKPQLLDRHHDETMTKDETEKADSSSKLDGDEELDTNMNGTFENSHDKMIDPKRVKRILANRQSAQRSRVRKLQYISELERSVNSLQAEVSVLSPRVAFLDHQRLILNVDNSALKQRIATLAQDKIFKDAHQEALRKEIERLRKVYQEQDLKKMHNNNHYNATNSSSIDAKGSIENEPVID